MITRRAERLYLHGDHLGSTSLTTDQDGNVASEQRYLPYGDPRQPDTAPTDLGFTSQRAEASFGLMDYNARYYSPLLGRFVSPDSIVPEPTNPKSYNRYAYVVGNPLKYHDPTGHCWSFASGLRSTFYSTTCGNLDMAHTIISSPDATIGQKTGAGLYAGAVYVSHATVAVGSTVAAVGCLTGAGTAVCTGAGTAVTTASADGDPTNEAIAAGNVVSNLASRACADGDCTNELNALNKAAQTLSRGSQEYGGFARGITPQEIIQINQRLGGVTTMHGHPSSALAQASYHQGFWNKSAAIVKEIAGGHMFNDANKRTAQTVVETLMSRNNIATGATPAQMQKVILEVAKGNVTEINQIARLLQEGF